MVMALCLVAAMAVACPNPVPVEPNEEDSQALIYFKAQERLGLYMESRPQVLYNQQADQLSWNSTYGNFRIESDDEEKILSVVSDKKPEDRDALFRITVKNPAGEFQLIVVLSKIMSEDGYVWWWNEYKEIGLIMVEEGVEL